jgi:hypothetical protein
VGPTVSLSYLSARSHTSAPLLFPQSVVATHRVWPRESRRRRATPSQSWLQPAALTHRLPSAAFEWPFPVPVLLPRAPDGSASPPIGHRRCETPPPPLGQSMPGQTLLDWCPLHGHSPTLTYPRCPACRTAHVEWPPGRCHARPSATGHPDRAPSLEPT